MHHDDVLFQWCFQTTSVQETVGLLLIERLIQLYVTVRGFGFATSCVEMYKQHTKQSLQRKTSCVEMYKQHTKQSPEKEGSS